MKPAAQLIAEGRSAAPKSFPQTAFLRGVNAKSEVEYKQRCRDNRVVTYHAHTGLSTWEATEDGLRTIHAGLAAHGHHVDRFGLAFDRAMGVPEAERSQTTKETGPRIEANEWTRLAQAVPIQPHVGDYMIGLPAGFQNTVRALSAGVTTIGNISQFSAYEPIGGSDPEFVTEETVRALGAIAALRSQGSLAHSNLEDGTGNQASHFGAFVGWAAIELYVIEHLIGARLGQCFGNTIQSPEHRAIVHFALDDLRGRDSIGTMMFGNTVDVRAGNTARNIASLAAQVSCDIALQLRRPTGHAIHPIPLTEAERIPSPEEIIEVHLLARELEHEVRKAPDLYDWERLERIGAMVAAYAVQWRDKALGVFVEQGIDVHDAAQVLFALRTVRMPDLERRVNLEAPDDIAVLRPWKSSHVKRLADNLHHGVQTSGIRLDGKRVVLAVLEVHDLVRDALASVLPRAGAEVILLGSDASIEAIARAAIDEDANAIVLGSYNGNALELGDRVMQATRSQGWEGRLFMGGVLNQDTGNGLPVDARPQLERLGVHCVSKVDDLVGLLAAT